MGTPSTPTLLRSLRRWDLVAVVLNGVIGAGIFGLPSKVFALAGNYSLLAFGACGICAWIIVLSFAEVGSQFKGTGGPYLFARETYGGTIGFVVGWLMGVARVTAFAANVVLLPEYLGFFVPAAASGLPRAAILTCVVAFFAVLNVRGVRYAANWSNFFGAGKLIPLAIFIVVGFFFVEPARLTLAVAPSYGNFSHAVLMLIVAFTGFEMALIPSGEARSPGRDLPAALVIGMATVVTIYVLLQAVCMGTLPGLAESNRPLADAAARFMGSGGAAMIMAAILISLAGNLNVLILTTSRLVYAMGEQGDLPPAMAAIHPRFRTPAWAVVATTAVMLAVALSGTFVYLITLSAVARLTTFFATCGALPILRRRARTALEGFRLPGGTAIAVAGMLVSVWMISSCTLRQARDAVLATVVGLAIYGIVHWRRKSAARLAK